MRELNERLIMLIDGKRALAYIVEIDSITTIDGADNIELAHVGGWNVIVSKQQYKVGEHAVFVEIDSKLPETEWSEFLRPKHFNVKSMKLNKFGVISQGLLFPLGILPDNKEYELHTDVTDILGITYSVQEDNERKAVENPDEKYHRMTRRHPNLAKKKWFQRLMKYSIGKKLLFVFLGSNKDRDTKNWPNWITHTDEDRCLIGDTKIITDHGVLRIADIVNKRLNVKIKSYNEDTKEIEYKSINSYQKYENKEKLIEIEYPYKGNSFRKNRILCSSDHKFFVNGEYVLAKDLCVGDNINMLANCYSDDVIPIIYGMLLGDSSIENDKRCKSNNVRVSTCQGEAQIDYLKLKQSIFGEENFKIYKCKSGYCDNNVYKGELIADINIANNILHDCYINGKKTITKNMIDKMNELSLAFWYLDDGSIKYRIKKNGNNPNLMLFTCAYTKEENELLIDMLKNKFGIESNLRREKNKYWSIYITTAGTKIFLNLIKDYIPVCMKYKTLIEYENLPCILNNIKFKRSESLVDIIISNIKVYNEKKRYGYIYDLEVADNHNFFANNILTHNCENMTWILNNKNPFVVSEKIDGTSQTVFLDLANKKKVDFGVCSRNVRQPDYAQDNNVYWEMTNKYNMREAIEDIAKLYNVKKIVIQGETYGLAVQGNPYKLNERRFAAFNLIFDGERLGSIQAKNILAKYDIPFVPIVDEAYVLPDDFEELKLTADGNSTINNKCKREGLVYRDQDGKTSFKNISRLYLLKHKQ